MSKRTSLALLVLVLVQLIPARASAAQQSNAALRALPSLAEPGVSPDGSEIAFVSGGDVWTVAARGGEAHLLVSHPANESRPLYSPDGSRIAFTSTRTGNGAVYVLDLAGGALRRITFDDGLDLVDGWSRDGRWIYFSSSSRDIAGMNDVFRVAADGGTPMAVSADRYVSEYFSAESPDGQTLAINARAIAFAQWWRHGHSHIDEAEIWLVGPGERPTYEPVAERGAKQLWPMWSQNGRSLYFVSDRNGAENVWVKPIGTAGAARAVTSFRDGRVLWPSISRDAKTIVFERDFGIWSLDTSSGDAREVKIALRGAPAAQATDHVTLTGGVSEVALSPDGKKVAFVVRGEVFATATTDGGNATRVTSTPAVESQVVWTPDSRRLVYVSNRSGATNIYAYDFATSAETRLTASAEGDFEPRVSPDGKTVAFIRDAREVRALDLASKAERQVATALFERPPLNSDRQLAWSPDGKWIAYFAIADRLFKNVRVVPAAGGESRQVSFLANVGGNTLAWAPDGSFLTFDTGQRTESGQIARVDLVPRTPRFREDQFRDLFREQQPPGVAPAQRPEPPAQPQPAPQPATAPAPAPDAAPPVVQSPQPGPPAKPAEFVFEGIRRRLSLIPVGLDVGFQTISPDGKSILMVAASAGQQNLYLYSIDDLATEPAVARQLTATAGPKGFPQYSSDGKSIVYVDGGQILSLSVDSGQAKPIGVRAEMDVDFDAEKREVFAQAWGYMRDWFYDPKFHGVDWQRARATFEPRIAGARTSVELRRLLSLMVGELNASHLGANSPGGAPETTGRLGLRFDRLEYERSGALRVTEVVALGPADLTRSIRPGDYLVSVDGARVGRSVNLDELLGYKVGRRVSLAVASSADGAGSREVAVLPVNRSTEKGLLYRAWVEWNRAYVDRASNGRLGYVHMFDMSEASLNQLFVDLDAENQGKEGVVVDIRNNNGGFVNVYAIDVLARRSYLSMTFRGFPGAPARTVLGQRSLERPTVLVTNQHSLSDAEDFSEGYRTLGLGRIVGEPTSGWIIYTSNVPLVDGTIFRIPFNEIKDSKGMRMELAPRPVDVPVTRPIGEGLADRDSQLDAAVRVLLKR
jgi:Tol biopolymer transport system component/C-terminal processing protease CtpA/Prc